PRNRKEVLYENLANWDKQMKIEIEKTKAFSIQGHKENKTNTLKGNINTTIDGTYEKQATKLR
ncbi:16704_t:CDS:2, partial [Cetraspora pellucida]